MNGVSRFNIHRDYGSKDRLPSSHTCFNREFYYSAPLSMVSLANRFFAELDLPEYENYETLRSQLLKAITAGSDYFGFA